MIHDDFFSSNNEITPPPDTALETRTESLPKPRRRGLAHVIRDAAPQMPRVFTAVDMFEHLSAHPLCATADLQKVKWALKYLASTGQVNIATAGAPGQFGRVPSYSFHKVPAPPPDVIVPEIHPAVLASARNLFLSSAPPVCPESLPQFHVEEPRVPESRRIDGIAPYNPNVPELHVIEQRLETLRAELATAILAHAMSDQEDVITDLHGKIATWERKERLARQGEGQGV